MARLRYPLSQVDRTPMTYLRHLTTSNVCMHMSSTGWMVIQSRFDDSRSRFEIRYMPSAVLIKEIGNHTLLLNKFALIPQHFLLVTRGELMIITKCSAHADPDCSPRSRVKTPSSSRLLFRSHEEFEPQTMPPTPATLSASFQILSSLPNSRPENLLCFFNCGPESGASQAHCHLQFVDLKDGGGVLTERLLDRIERDGKEMGESCVVV